MRPPGSSRDVPPWQAASASRARELELERASDELARAARDQQQAQKHALLELARQQQALADERSAVQVARALLYHA